MGDRSLQDLLDAAESPVELLRNNPSGANVFPGVPPEYTNWRDEQRAWQETCVLFNQTYHMNDLAVEGPDALTLLSRLAVNSFEGFARRQGQALRAVHAGRLRDRRRDPLPPRGEPVQPRRPRAGAELDHVPRRDRRLRRATRARRPVAAAQRRAPQVLPLPAAGPERDGGDREGARLLAAGASVLPHDGGDDRRQERSCAASRHGRPAGLGAVRALGGRGDGARGARRARARSSG